MFKGEKVFQSEKQVKYYFKPSYNKTDKLIIVFSAFSAIGKPPSYNYVRTLEGFDCNKLFILDDFGCRASYYLCENRDFNIERSVIALINHIVKENNIKTIMSCGSSKGGYAALYYGIKYGFDNIVAASPQFLLGDYLLKETNTNNVATFMSGSDTEKDIEFLNGIMRNEILKSKNNPNIFIHLGERERHYRLHVKPMLKLLEDSGFKYEIDLGDYSEHNDVGKYYPSILKNKVKEHYSFPLIELNDITNQNIPLHSTMDFKAITESGNKIAWYLYRNNKRIDYKKYSLVDKYTVSFEEPGKYYIKAFAVNESGLKTSTKTRNILVK